MRILVLTGTFLSVIFPHISCAGPTSELSGPVCLFSPRLFWFHLNRTGIPEHCPFAGVWELCPSPVDPAACGMTTAFAFVVKKEVTVSFSPCRPSALLHSVLKTYSVCIVGSQPILFVKKIRPQVLKIKELSSTQTVHFIQ